MTVQIKSSKVARVMWGVAYQVRHIQVSQAKIGAKRRELIYVPSFFSFWVLINRDTLRYTNKEIITSLHSQLLCMACLKFKEYQRDLSLKLQLFNFIIKHTCLDKIVTNIPLLHYLFIVFSVCSNSYTATYGMCCFCVHWIFVCFR